MQTEVITLTRNDQALSPNDTGVVSFDTALQNGPEAALLFVGLNAVNIPAGCEIWFQNVDGDIPIAIPPTVVTQSNFFVGVQVQLPANYTCTIRSFLQLNGHQLPPGANLSLTVSQIVHLAAAALHPSQDSDSAGG